MSILENVLNLTGTLANAIWTQVTKTGVERLLKDGVFAGKHGLKNFDYFLPSENDDINLPFYQRLFRQMQMAKSTIYISGEGFEFTRAAASKIINEYKEVTRAALERGVSIVRVQNGTKVSKEWLEALKYLIAYPGKGKFDLYVAPVDDEGIVGATRGAISFCVIDGAMKRNAVVELMISDRHFFETKTGKFAGTAIFMLRNKEAATTLSGFITEAVTPEHKITTAAQVDFQFSCSENYFAYGSNMDDGQMHKRTPSAERVGIGYIDGYKMDFNRRGTYRAGGVASVTEAPGEKVYGIVWKLTPKDLGILDDIEDPRAYQRLKITVKLEDGQQLPCNVYESIPQKGHIEPDRDYLDLIIKAAESCQLPASYVAGLKRLR